LSPADPTTEAVERMPLEVHAPGIPDEEARRAARHIEALERFADGTPVSARLTVRRAGGSQSKPVYVADASVLWGRERRVLAGHATGPSPEAAAKEAADRLRRRMRAVVGAQVARRDEPAGLLKALRDLEPVHRHRPAARLKPPELRDIVRRRAAMPRPLTTFEAVTDLIDLDLEFYLFTHARTGEDVVVYRRDDGRVGLLHPQGSPLAEEDGLVVPEPSRYPDPIDLARARDEMDVLEHRFLYFIDAADGRGKVIYLRHDGDYGLVEPVA
jgi:hypothetical protein